MRRLNLPFKRREAGQTNGLDIKSAIYSFIDRHDKELVLKLRIRFI